MTLAKQFRQEGMQRGLQQSEAAVLRHLFIRRFGNLSETYKTQLKYASTDQILAWCNKILDAKTPQDIFNN